MLPMSLFTLGAGQKAALQFLLRLLLCSSAWTSLCNPIPPLLLL